MSWHSFCASLDHLIDEADAPSRASAAAAFSTSCAELLAGAAGRFTRFLDQTLSYTVNRPRVALLRACIALYTSANDTRVGVALDLLGRVCLSKVKVGNTPLADGDDETDALTTLFSLLLSPPRCTEHDVYFSLALRFATANDDPHFRAALCSSLDAAVPTVVASLAAPLSAANAAEQRLRAAANPSTLRRACVFSKLLLLVRPEAVSAPYKFAFLTAAVAHGTSLALVQELITWLPLEMQDAAIAHASKRATGRNAQQLESFALRLRSRQDKNAALGGASNSDDAFGVPAALVSAVFAGSRIGRPSRMPKPVRAEVEGYGSGGGIPAAAIAELLQAGHVPPAVSSTAIPATPSWRTRSLLHALRALSDVQLALVFAGRDPSAHAVVLNELIQSARLDEARAALEALANGGGGGARLSAEARTRWERAIESTLCSAAQQSRAALRTTVWAPRLQLVGQSRAFPRSVAAASSDDAADITYVTKECGLRALEASILSELTGLSGTSLLLGCDAEWQPLGRYGNISLSPRVSLLQLATVSRAWVIDVQLLRATSPALLAETLCRVFSNERVIFVGRGIRDDIAHVMRVVSGRAGLGSVRVFDLGAVCEPVDGSLSQVAERWLRRPLSKDLQASDWDARPLSFASLSYAALDALAAVRAAVAAFAGRAPTADVWRPPNAAPHLDDSHAGDPAPRTESSFLFGPATIADALDELECAASVALVRGHVEGTAINTIGCFIDDAEPVVAILDANRHVDLRLLAAVAGGAAARLATVSELISVFGFAPKCVPPFALNVRCRAFVDIIGPPPFVAGGGGDDFFTLFADAAALEESARGKVARISLERGGGGKGGR